MLLNWETCGTLCIYLGAVIDTVSNLVDTDAA